MYNKKHLFVAVAFGIAVGGSAGYYLGNKKHAALLAESEEALEDLRNDFDDVITGMKEDLKAAEEYADEVFRTVQKQNVEAYRSGKTVEEAEAEVDEFLEEANEKFSDPEEEHNIFEDLESEVVPGMSVKDHNTPPYLITEDQFDNEHIIENIEFDKLETTFYANDGILADDGGTVIHNVVTILGEEGLISFGQKGNPGNMAYFRNNKMRTDYSVIRIEESYFPTESDE